MFLLGCLSSAALDSLRNLRGWGAIPAIAQQTWSEVMVFAVDYWAMAASRSWFETGSLALGTAAASPLVDDFMRLGLWTSKRLVLLPFGLPDG